MDAKHTLEVQEDLTGRDIVFDPSRDILTPIRSSKFGRRVAWVDATPIDEMGGFSEALVSRFNAHDDLVAACEAAIEALHDFYSRRTDFHGPLSTLQSACRAKRLARDALAKARA